MQFTDRIRTKKCLYDLYKPYGSSNRSPSRSGDTHNEMHRISLSNRRDREAVFSDRISFSNRTDREALFSDRISLSNRTDREAVFSDPISLSILDMTVEMMK